MKDLIKQILKEYVEEQEILHIPSFKYFNDDWEMLQRFLQLKGNPLYSIGGNLYLRNTPIESLGNLTSVGGYLNLTDTPIKSLGNLTSVGGYLNLENTPISEKYSEKEIRKMVKVEGEIYL